MPFLRNVPGLETVYRDFAPKGVRFRIVYKSIVHPGTNGMVEAYTLEERLQHLEIARARLKTTVPWLCDSMNNEIQHALDAAPNGEFVIDGEGKILRKKFWHDPTQLRAFLTDLVGPLEKPTKVADLGMKLEFPEQPVQRGIVPPLKMTERMRVLRTAPKQPAERPDPQPFFAKLLAEGNRGLLREGKGKLYIGFYVDPLYGVHWNNPAGGLQWEITKPGDSAFEMVRGAAPKYEHDTDVDPREFLVDFAGDKGDVFELTVHYTVCDDAETFCLEVSQRYSLKLEVDPDGGSRAGDWMTRLCGDPMQFDENGDGKVTRDELPAERAQIILNHADRNHDDVITKSEADLFHDMIRIKPGETGR